MKKLKQVLIINNNETMVNTIKKVFTEITKLNPKTNFSFKILESPQFALIHLQETKLISYNLIILNIDIPEPTNTILKFTEDIGVQLRLLFPDAKILLTATVCDNFRINNAFKKFSPEAFVIENNINFNTLLKAITAIVNNNLYYSKHVLNLMRHLTTSNLQIDNTNVLILYYLSKGIKTKDLINYVPLTIGGVEKRKRILKDLFKVDDGLDETLINRAKENGFI